MKNGTYTAIMLVSMPLASIAQVQVDKAILLTGPAQPDRQVSGLALSTDPADALTAGVAQSGVLQLAEPAPGNSWQATLPGIVGEIGIGTHVVVKAPVTAGGPLTILLNGNGPYALVNGTTPLDGAMLVPGQMLSLVFDGTAMQVINGRNDLRRTCPEGMVAPSDLYCIETSQRTAADFFTAAVTCASDGGRLCSWAEFHLACVDQLALGLADMTGNWEWTNNTANEDNSVRVTGQVNCTSATTWMATGTTPLTYRCCYSR